MMVTTEYFLPVWVQLLIGLAAALVAGGIIWKKLIQPLVQLITLMSAIHPLLKDLVEQFEDSPHAFAVLNQIIKEFRSDSGSTLRDVVNRLEQAANENRIAAQVLATNAETARQLSAQDRQHLAQLVEQLNRFGAKQRENISAVDRIEAGGKIVASELDAAQSRAEKIQGEPGEAADAAVRRTTKE